MKIESLQFTSDLKTKDWKDVDLCSLCVEDIKFLYEMHRCADVLLEIARAAKIHEELCEAPDCAAYGELSDALAKLEEIQ